MFNSSITNAQTWSSLSQTEREQGIHPTKLTSIRFDFGESEINGDLLQQLHKFFVGCRLATTDSDFISHSVRLLNPNEKLLQPIRTVVERVLICQMPKEKPIQYDNCPIHFVGVEYGTPYSEYKEKFVLVYNQLIEKNLSYLMHPARRTELIQYLETSFQDADFAADRLITYRCYGSYALNISEQERGLAGYMHEYEQVQKRISSLYDNGPQLISESKGLQEDDLTCIRNNSVRKYVCIAYNTLAKQKKLDVLDLSEDELHKYLGNSDHRTHVDLTLIADKYYEEISLVGDHFGVVIKYLKTLRNNDLNDLMQCVLTEELERFQRLIESTNDFFLLNARTNYQNGLNLLNKKPEDFKPGDFSFLSDPMTARTLSNAFEAVENLNEWPFFDMDPPENKGYMFWNHPTLNKIMSKLDSDGHTGASVGFTMRWMQRIRNKGWNVVVREALEDTINNFGVLNKAARN